MPLNNLVRTLLAAWIIFVIGAYLVQFEPIILAILRKVGLV